MKRFLLIIFTVCLIFCAACSREPSNGTGSLPVFESGEETSVSAVSEQISATSGPAEEQSTEISEIPEESEESDAENEITVQVDAFLCKDVDRSLKATNVFLDRTYKPSKTALDSKPDPYVEKLTNGWTNAICTPRNTVGYGGAEPMRIDFDMGDEYHEIADITVVCHRIVQYGYGLPAYISVRVSDDNVKFTEIGKVETPSDLDDACRYFYRFAFKKAFTARYIRINFGQNEGEQLCIDEISAYEYSESGVLENKLGVDEDQVYCVKDFYDYSLDTGGPKAVFSETDADYDELQNLARLPQVDFQIIHYDPLYLSHENSGRDRLYLLTDGVQHGKDIETDYFKFHRGAGRDVICDLGAVMSVQSCVLAFMDLYTWGITTPPAYYISISENGSDWATVFAEHNPDYGKTIRRRDTRKCDFGGEYKARYVKLSFTTVPDNKTSAFVYLGEFEIYGRKNTSNAASAGTNNDIVYGRYPTTDEFGFGDILFTCITDGYGKHCTDVHVLTEETAKGYMIAEDAEGNAVPLMDCFMFTTRGELNEHSNRSEGFSFFLDELFYEGVNMDAVENVTPYVNETLGKTGKTPVWISVNCPAAGDTFEGRKIVTAEDYISCLKWQADEAIRRFNEKDYSNVYLVGFYWQHENIRSEAHDAEAAIAFNEYIHSLGYKSIWCPYYTAYGLWNAHYYGFDLTCLQPNYMFSYSLPGRIDAAAEIAKMYGLGIEIEIENLYQSRDALDYYRKYLRGGYDHGYMDAVNVYYQGSIPGTYINCPKRGDPISLAIYDETVLYANGKITEDYDIPVPADLSAFSDKTVKTSKNARCSVELGGLYAVKYRFSQTPSYGSVKLDESGTLYYKPTRGFIGEDTVEIELCDNAGGYKTVTVYITVE